MTAHPICSCSGGPAGPSAVHGRSRLVVWAMPELGRLLPAFGQFSTEQVHEQAIVEMAVAAALVLAHDADRAEAHRGVAADGLSVGGRRVNRDPVMTALVEQEPGEQPDSLAARALALETAAEVDVDPGMPVHRVVLLVVLDAPGDLAVDLQHQKHRRPAAAQVFLDHRHRIRLAPPPRDRRLGQDRAQALSIIRLAWPEPDAAARQYRAHPGVGLPAVRWHSSSIPAWPSTPHREHHANGQRHREGQDAYRHRVFALTVACADDSVAVAGVRWRL